MSKRKMHVLDGWGSYGGFHREYEATCRCGAEFRHYNAGEARRQYLAHKAEREEAGEMWEDARPSPLTPSSAHPVAPDTSSVEEG